MWTPPGRRDASWRVFGQLTAIDIDEEGAFEQMTPEQQILFALNMLQTSEASYSSVCCSPATTSSPGPSGAHPTEWTVFLVGYQVSPTG
jgi:hypothetical protein